MEDRYDLEKCMDDYEIELDEDLSKQLKSKAGSSVFLVEASNLLRKLDINVEKKCADEIQNFKKNFYIDGKRDNNVFPKQKNDPFAEKMYRDLERCTERYEILEADINEMIQFAVDFYDLQFKVCRFNCLSKMHQLNEIPKVKTCLRRCYFYTYEYIDRAMEDALQIFLSDKSNQLEDTKL